MSSGEGEPLQGGGGGDGAGGQGEYGVGEGAAASPKMQREGGNEGRNRLNGASYAGNS